ncbi:UDP-N-acetylmuramoyl-L-alanine--D-glutamate ligase [Polynucleobacter difficilis]|uniref:UDP-N-acetylmuramoyl-L-alanine--D-glutamate ligase n=1 Tax=Polynucleobacter difficilis TaxID=556054 RepID=UPI000D34C05C|nr:UDP-N-acetylmuramoyl-L-alanine--D-glutamate ligase [Polynucleobacter difficilis]
MRNVKDPFVRPELSRAEALSVEPTRFLILGLGESGIAMTNWCLRHGAHTCLVDTRERSALNEKQQAQLSELEFAGLTDMHFGSWNSSFLDQIDVIGISPGLSPIAEPAQSILAAAQEKGIPVWSEIEFFARGIAALERESIIESSDSDAWTYAPKIVAITGTNGKTTTTALVGQLCERAGKTVAVAGNISPAALDKLMACLDSADGLRDLPELWVLELSSFQLHFTYSLNPSAATVLNLSQDHLDWHGDMQAYATAKAAIFGPSSICIVNRDEIELNRLLSSQLEDRQIIHFGSNRPDEPGSFGIERDPQAGGIDWLVWAEVDEDAELEKPKRRRKVAAVEAEPIRLKRLIPADALRIRGKHNALNALAALALARAVGLPLNKLLHGLREYRGEPHRVQSVAIIRDVEYVDDSKGTNVGATVAALNGLGDTAGAKKIWLIAGGDGKGQDFSPLFDPVQRFAKGVLLIGKDAPLIQDALQATGVAVERCETITVAVKTASERAASGDVVLLSPACASFDQFKDYVHRAAVFVSEVEELGMQFSDSSLEADCSSGVSV